MALLGANICYIYFNRKLNVVMAEIQICYTKNVLRIIIIIIVHISYYYPFWSVQSPSQRQRAMYFSSVFLHLHRSQQPFKHPQRISSSHDSDVSGNLIQNGCHPVRIFFSAPVFKACELRVTSRNIGMKMYIFVEFISTSMKQPRQICLKIHYCPIHEIVISSAQITLVSSQSKDIQQSIPSKCPAF